MKRSAPPYKGHERRRGFPEVPSEDKITDQSSLEVVYSMALRFMRLRPSWFTLRERVLNRFVMLPTFLRCTSLTILRQGSPVEGESRNVLAESARIARGAIKPLAELKASSVDAVIFPGGFGAAKNLSDWAVKGKDCTVLPDVERVLKDFHASKKPIGLCCISPVLAAKVLPGTTLTLGQNDNKSGKWPYAETIEGASSLGAIVVPKTISVEEDGEEETRDWLELAPIVCG
uniref:DJ-1/PfpI domain-containing protein n=1 Tax=Timema douglasi TaxID=61478 RepID=A0A7R8VHP3_TIMDO|nr:unnamed protein product [Timema douglasi]